MEVITRTHSPPPSPCCHIWRDTNRGQQACLAHMIPEPDLTHMIRHCAPCKTGVMASWPPAPPGTTAARHRSTTWPSQGRPGLEQRAVPRQFLLLLVMVLEWFVQLRFHLLCVERAVSLHSRCLFKICPATLHFYTHPAHTVQYTQDAGLGSLPAAFSVPTATH